MTPTPLDPRFRAALAERMPGLLFLEIDALLMHIEHDAATGSAYVSRAICRAYNATMDAGFAPGIEPEYDPALPDWAAWCLLAVLGDAVHVCEIEGPEIDPDAASLNDWCGSLAHDRGDDPTDLENSPGLARAILRAVVDGHAEWDGGAGGVTRFARAEGDAR